MSVGLDRRVLLSLTAAVLACGGARSDDADVFRDALDNVRHAASAAGIAPTTIDAAFAGLTPDPKVIALGQRQSEFNRPIGSYVEGAVSSSRVARGRVLAGHWADALSAAQARYGVPPGIVLALWAVESEYGAATGGFDTVRSLATLAAFGDRTDLFRTELVAALRILDGGRVARSRLTGSWAGAMGQTQFTPSSYLRYAADADGDGLADIWGSVPDVIASIAAFMGGEGWDSALPWGYPVRLPPDADLPADGRLSLDRWTRAGIRRSDGGTTSGVSAAELFLPHGRAGPAFLVTRNFEVIRAYNTSDAYALTVGLLADRIDGAPPGPAWPRTPGPSPTEIRDAQHALAGKGLYDGPKDGRLGPRMRKAVRLAQVEYGLPPTGYLDRNLLARLAPRGIR
jgi:lytic murein transglycosylase